MNDAELRDMWRHSPAGVDVALEAETLWHGLARRLNRLERIHWLRDHYEMIAAVVAMPVLVWLAVEISVPAVRAGACLGMAVFAGILVINARSRRLRREVRSRSNDLRRRLTAEKRDIERRIRLYRSSWAWFFIPLMAGLDLILAFHPSFPSPLNAFLICLVSIDMLAIAVYVVPRIVRGHLRPALREVEWLLLQFGDELRGMREEET